jgi:hypothetical protein
MVVVVGPDSETKYVAPNSSRNGSSVMVGLGASHGQAKAAALLPAVIAMTRWSG